MQNPPDNDGSRRMLMKGLLVSCACLAPGTLLPKFLERTWSSTGIGVQNDEREQRMNAALSAKALRQLHDVMSGYVERGEVPGLVTLVSYHGLGSSWWNDPNERLTAIIVTERTFESADPPNVIKDFWKSANEAVRTGS
jgi:hypothetical protein